MAKPGCNARIGIFLSWINGGGGQRSCTMRRALTANKKGAAGAFFVIHVQLTSQLFSAASSSAFSLRYSIGVMPTQRLKAR